MGKRGKTDARYAFEFDSGMLLESKGLKSFVALFLGMEYSVQHPVHTSFLVLL
jgi:hypothetical protein